MFFRVVEPYIGRSYIYFSANNIEDVQKCCVLMHNVEADQFIREFDKEKHRIEIKEWVQSEKNDILEYCKNNKDENPREHLKFLGDRVKRSRENNEFKRKKIKHHKESEFTIESKQIRNDWVSNIFTNLEYDVADKEEVGDLSCVVDVNHYFNFIKWERNLNHLSDDELILLSSFQLPDIVPLEERKK